MATHQLSDLDRILQFISENPGHSDTEAARALGIRLPIGGLSQLWIGPRLVRDEGARTAYSGVVRHDVAVSQRPQIVAHRRARLRRDLRRKRYQDGGEMQFA